MWWSCVMVADDVMAKMLLLTDQSWCRSCDSPESSPKCFDTIRNHALHDNTTVLPHIARLETMSSET